MHDTMHDDDAHEDDSHGASSHEDGRMPHDAHRDAEPRDGLLERARALAAGRLSAAEQERLLLEVSASSADRELMEAFREVHALTAVADEEPPTCRVSFEDVEARIAADRAGDSAPVVTPVWRSPLRLAAAALLLLGVGLAASHFGAFGAGPRDGDTQDREAQANGQAVSSGEVATANPTAAARAVTVTSIPEHALQALDLDVLADVEAAAGVLAAFEPLRDGEPQWLGSLDEGRAVARVTGRPVLLFIHHPTCPICLDLKSKTFTDADVQLRLQQFVPVMVNVMVLPEDLAGFLERGWPYLGALDADGGEFAAFPGMSKASTFRRHLDGALTEFGARERRAWGPMRALASRWNDAVQAADAGDAGREWRELDALHSDDAEGPIGRSAATRLAQHDADVRAVIGDADEAAQADVVAGLALLDAAIGRWSGTPYEPDLRAIRDALQAEGRFPQLEFTSKEVH